MLIKDRNCEIDGLILTIYIIELQKEVLLVHQLM